MTDIEFTWRGSFISSEVEALHAAGFGHEATGRDWFAQVEGHSLGWVVARRSEVLIGFLNIAWDGGSHAFVLDPVVAAHEGRKGLGSSMVSFARQEVAAAGCEWLHVDFDDHLRHFYLESCGFSSTPAGVLRVNARIDKTSSHR
jgi:hypothetical protein